MYQRIKHHWQKFDNFMNNKIGEELWDAIVISIFVAFLGLMGLSFLWLLITFLFALNDYVAFFLIACIIMFILKVCSNGN